MRKMTKWTVVSALVACGLALGCAGCDSAHPDISPDARQGAKLMSDLGCGTCHTIPGINGANANVGPSLERIASRIYIAGMLRNNPENLRRWIEHSQEVIPGNAMPDLPMSDESARKIVAYLETLR
jgi:cytochrome c2